MRTAILTDFVSHDPAYSLCGVVANQVKMLEGQDLTLFVRKGFDPLEAAKAYGPRHEVTSGGVVALDPGKVGSNTVEVTPESEAEISSLLDQMRSALDGIDVVLTHDLLYQANMWKYHVAARRYAREHPATRWLHWVHSSTDLGTARQTKQFARELAGPFPNSHLVAMHAEEVNRKGSMFGFERDRIVIIPNPVDVMEGYDPLTRRLLGPAAHKHDIIIVYPARLDRGKQVEVVGEIAEALNLTGWDTRAIIVDFHSTAGDKATYRKALKDKYGPFMQFTSDHADARYHVPHKVVMDLFDYADVFIHPSRSESDPLTVPEAMWKRNLLLLNFDLPLFRQHDGFALFGKFSSNIDALSGTLGETNTSYENRSEYMKRLAGAIAFMAEQDMVVRNHRYVRQTRSVEAVAERFLLPAIAGVRGTP